MSMLSTAARGVFSAALSFVPGGKLGIILVLGGLGIASVLGAYAVWHSHVYNQGKEDTLNAIARNDAKIVSQAVSRRRLVIDCDAVGMRWNQATGKCGG